MTGEKADSEIKGAEFKGKRLGRFSEFKTHVGADSDSEALRRAFDLGYEAEIEAGARPMELKHHVEHLESENDHLQTRLDEKARYIHDLERDLEVQDRIGRLQLSMRYGAAILYGGILLFAILVGLFEAGLQIPLEDYLVGAALALALLGFVLITSSIIFAALWRVYGEFFRPGLNLFTNSKN